MKNKIDPVVISNIDIQNEKIETIASYLDAIIYLLEMKGIITSEELVSMLKEVTKKNDMDRESSHDETINYSGSKRGFMNPDIGDA